MNRIIKRLAAYIDDNGNYNTDIDQKISNQIYDTDYLAINKLYLIMDGYIAHCALTYEYEPISIGDIGLCGKKISKDNDEYHIEIQVKQLKESSIDEARQILDDIIYNKKYQLTTTQQQQLIDMLENHIENNYYFIDVIIFKNRLYYKSQHYIKDINYTIDQLKILGQKLINYHINDF